MKWQRARPTCARLAEEVKFIGRELWVQIGRPEIRPTYCRGTVHDKYVNAEPAYLTNLVWNDGAQISVAAEVVELLSAPDCFADSAPTMTWEEWSK